MSERLRHLQRQRDLLREHLAWIESEIARENPTTPTAAIPLSSAIAPQPTPEPAANAEAEALIEKYAATERQNPDDIRRGCLYAFSSAVILLAAGITAVWLLFYR